MVDLTATLHNVFGGITMSGTLKVIGWLLFIIILICSCVGGYWWWYSRKQFNRIIVANVIVNGEWVTAHQDRAKTVKIGSGGYEVLYLRKLKVYKIAYASRIGGNKHEFYIMPDGYWYSGKRDANLHHINEKGGLIPIITTNPLMRAQYTALETHVEQLHGEKKSFMDKWGNWIFSIAWVLITGVMMWLIVREFTAISGQLSPLVEKVGTLVDRVNELLANTVNLNNNKGLIPA